LLEVFAPPSLLAPPDEAPPSPDVVVLDEPDDPAPSLVLDFASDEAAGFSADSLLRAFFLDSDG